MFVPCLLVAALQTPADTALRRDTVSYASESIRIAGTVVQPRAAALRPALVVIHGSGNSGRTNPWTTAYVEALARAGVVVLHPDKRGAGASGGDWRTARFTDLAADAVAGMEWLRQQPGIDTSRIGVIAFSQGGYVAAALADVRLPAMTIVVSGGVMSLRDQMVDEIVIEAERSSAPMDSSEVAVLRRIYGRAFEVAATNRGWGELQHAATAARARSARLTHALRTLPADSGHWAFRWVGTVGDADPIPMWKRHTEPVLFVFGGADAQVRVRDNVARIWDSLGAGMPGLGVVVMQGNGHAMFRDDVTALIARFVHDRGAH